MTESGPPRHAPPPSRRKLPTSALAFIIAGAVIAVLVAGALIGAAVTGDDKNNSPTAGETATELPTAVPSSAQFRPGTVGQPFDLGHWRITVTSLKCGTAAELLKQNADNGQEPTDRVCVAFLSYTNIDTVPHLFGGTIDETVPESTHLGFAGESAYTGHKWLSEDVNPGLSQTNELIFKVPAGVTLDSVQIGDFLIKP